MRDEINDSLPGPEDDRIDPSTGWEERLEDHFRLWRSQISADQTPLEPPDDTPPDLYAFFAELCALRTEMRRSARRSHETLASFAETLSRFDSVLEGMTQREEASSPFRENDTDARNRSFFLGVLDLFERFKRISGRMSDSPTPGFFFTSRRWESAWQSLREGFGILKEHFEDLLRNEGITPIETLGRPFDPNLMEAVAFERSAGKPPNTVAQELSGGYLHRGKVLKYAKVKVVIAKGNT